jgi:hypothetical protein
MNFMGDSNPRTKQQGIVSIMVVSILIVLLSLVTIGFSRLMNRETRQALDKQLGLQSYYAAESGVNDAITYLNKVKASGNDFSAAAITKCSDDKAKGLNQNLSGEPNPNAQYSCVLIDPEPDAVEYHIKAGQSKVFSFDQERLTSLLVSWQNSEEKVTDNYRPTGRTDFPSISNWNNVKGNSGATGVLRISIYPVMIRSGAPNVPARTDWLDDKALTAKYSRTFFLYPDKAANAASSITPVDYYENNGAIITGQCDDSHTTIEHADFPGPPESTVFHCNSILNCLPDTYHGPNGTQSLDPTPPYTPPLACLGHGPGNEYRAEHYIVKITSLYATTDVQLRSAQSVGLIPVSLRGAQAVIDSTGKGNDVVRRVSARVSLTPNGSGEVGSDLKSPETALRTAESVCKRIRQLTTGSIAVEDSVDPTCSEGISP